MLRRRGGDREAGVRHGKRLPPIKLVDALGRELSERMRELRCLYAVSELAERPGLTVTELLAGAVNLLPPARPRPGVHRE